MHYDELEALSSPLLYRLIILIMWRHLMGKGACWSNLLHTDELMGVGCCLPLWMELMAKLMMLCLSNCTQKEFCMSTLALELPHWGRHGQNPWFQVMFTCLKKRVQVQVKGCQKTLIAYSFLSLRVEFTSCHLVWQRPPLPIPYHQLDHTRGLISLWHTAGFRIVFHMVSAQRSGLN